MGTDTGLALILSAWGLGLMMGSLFKRKELSDSNKKNESYFEERLQWERKYRACARALESARDIAPNPAMVRLSLVEGRLAGCEGKISDINYVLNPVVDEED